MPTIRFKGAFASRVLELRRGGAPAAPKSVYTGIAMALPHSDGWRLRRFATESVDHSPLPVAQAAQEVIPERLRIALYLVGVEGFGHQEISDIRGAAIASVMSRLYWGRFELQHTCARERELLLAGARQSDS
ncbi:hypothetical protein ACWEQ2_38160 [Streptomyces sp. NPDC004096]